MTRPTSLVHGIRFVAYQNNKIHFGAACGASVLIGPCMKHVDSNAAASSPTTAKLILCQPMSKPYSRNSFTILLPERVGRNVSQRVF